MRGTERYGAGAVLSIQNEAAVQTDRRREGRTDRQTSGLTERESRQLLGSVAQFYKPGSRGLRLPSPRERERERDPLRVLLLSVHQGEPWYATRISSGEPFTT